MKIFEKNIDEVFLNPKNPRKNENAIEPVMKSIREYGFKQPLVIDESGMVLVGNTRLKAALKLGLKKVPVVIADDLTKDQQKAFALVDNKTSEFAEWDTELLAEELRYLNDVNIDLSDFNFVIPDNYDDYDFDDFFTDKPEPEEKDEEEEEEAPEHAPYSDSEYYQVIINLDDEDDMESLAERLEAEGYEVKTYSHKG